jgi:hypothetical protein
VEVDMATEVATLLPVEMVVLVGVELVQITSMAGELMEQQILVGEAGGLALLTKLMVEMEGLGLLLSDI